MHKMGYTFFNINALTISEINILINEYNRREKSKERAYKKAQSGMNKGRKR